MHHPNRKGAEMRHTRNPIRIVLAVALNVAAVLALFAASAPAAVVTNRPLLFSFNGHDASAGPFSPFRSEYDSGINTIAVDDSCAQQQPP